LTTSPPQLPSTVQDGLDCLALMKGFSVKAKRSHNQVIKEQREKTFSSEELDRIAQEVWNYYQLNPASFQSLPLDKMATQIARQIVITTYLAPLEQAILEKYRQIIASNQELADGVEREQLLNDTVKLASVPPNVLYLCQEVLVQKLVPTIRTILRPSDPVDEHLKGSG
ncbi:MAG: hypothetical protein ACHQUC_10825, partial [Chlamydiales bacterium]